MAGCIRIPLGMEIGLGQGDIVLYEDSAAPQKGWGTGSQQPPLFGVLCFGKATAACALVSFFTARAIQALY